MDDRTKTKARLRLAGLIALSVVAGLMAVVAVFVLVLRTSWGGERIRRQVVSRVNQKIKGRLDIERLSFGGDRLTVWNVNLRDPEGGVVAQVARAEVDFSIARLIHEELRITAVAIEAPRLDLISGAEGTNLARATAPRKKSPPSPPAKPKTKKEGWVVRLDHFELTNGDLRGAVASVATPDPKVHLADLHILISARYATGNGSLDLKLDFQGQSVLAPVGPIHLAADAVVRGDTSRVGIDGALLGGTMKVRADVDSAHLDRTEALIAVAIPTNRLAGYDWGPVRIDGQAHPGAAPKIDLSLAIPGIQLTGKGDGQDRFAFDGRLALADLGLTAKAAHALAGGDPVKLAGHGQIDFGLGGPMAGMPASWAAHIRGEISRVRFGDDVIDGLELNGKVAQLSSHPAQADLEVTVASFTAGTTDVRGIAFDAQVRQPEIAAKLKIDAPEPVNLILAARLDDDQQGLALERLTLAFPGGHWATEGVARLRFGGDRVSLSNLRLQSEGQVIAADAAKSDADLDAHLSIHDLRLGRLPALVVDPKLHLAGTVNADVKAQGEVDNPTVAASVEVQEARFRGFAKIGAKLKATLADQRVDGTLGVDAPFVAADAAFKMPVDPLAPGAPLDLRLEVSRLNVGETLRDAEMSTRADGRVSLRLHLTGSADSPKVDLTVNGKDLKVGRPPTAAGSVGGVGSVRKTAPEPTDVGHARVHLTYENRDLRADIDFASAHGGTARVDAGARVDLSYPKVTENLVVAKLPVRGRVLVKNLDVAWVAQFNPRIESMGGQVNADAKLAGTVGDPQVLGDVRWKNGQVVLTAPPPPTAKAPAPPRPSSGR